MWKVDQELDNALGDAEEPAASVSDDAIEKLWESTRKAHANEKDVLRSSVSRFFKVKVQAHSRWTDESMLGRTKEWMEGRKDGRPDARP